MRVAIFDMDGTLIDSSLAIERTINEIRADMGLDALNVKYIIKVINEPGRNLAFDLYGLQEPDTKMRNKFEQKFEENYALYARAYDGISELLDACKRANYGVALASNAPLYTLKAILKKCEIFEKFDEIIGADDQIPQKPDPKMLNIIYQNLGAKKAVFVGDSLKDELAAKNAKMPYVQVSWGFGKASMSANFNASDTKIAFEMIRVALDD